MASARRVLALAALPLAFLSLFFFLPLGAVLLHAAGSRPHDAHEFWALARQPLDVGLSVLHAGIGLFQNAHYRARIAFTLVQAAASTLLTLLIGLPLAYVFANHRFPLRRTLMAVLTTPFVLPAIVVALALHAAFGPASLTGVDALSVIGPFGAILAAHVFYNTSLVLRIVGAHWERVPRHVGETARTLGAAPLAAFWRAQFPLLRPAILASAALIFLFDMASFGVILLLGGKGTGTIETTIFELLHSFRPDVPTAAALGLLQLALAYTTLLVFLRLERRMRMPHAPRVDAQRERLPPWAGLPLAACAILFLLPMVSLLALSLRPAGEWSVDGWRALFGTTTIPQAPYSAIDAARNSVTFAGLALIPALALGLLSALAARGRRTAPLEGVLALPLGASSIVLGLGLLLAFNGEGLPDLRADPIRIVIAHVLLAFPLCARILQPALSEIAPGLREAGRTLGAAPFQLLRRVDLPLVAPALVVAAVYAIGTSLGEFGAALMLRAPETTTLPLLILDGFARHGTIAHAQALAAAALLMALATLGFLAAERFRPDRGPA